MITFTKEILKLAPSGTLWEKEQWSLEKIGSKFVLEGYDEYNRAVIMERFEDVDDLWNSEFEPAPFWREDWTQK